MNRKLVSAMTLTIVLIGILGVTLKVQKVKAPNGVITINADGSVDPPTAPIYSADNITYTFTDNINDSVIVLRSNIIIDGNGYTIQGPGSVTWYAGVHVEGYGSTNVTIQNVNITGFETAIALVSTDYNKILENNITDNGIGIYFAEAMNNTISENIITNNTSGISSNTLFYTTFSGNIITNNTNGIYFEFSSDNIMYENNITDNGIGILLIGMGVDNNTFYHNYFVDNTNQIYIDLPGNSNTWDDGYPSGGNFWSDFEERYPGVGDIYQGPDQDQLGGDGIWDGPYVMDDDNRDRYPLVPEFPTWTSMLLMLIILTVAIAFYKRKLSKTPIH